MKTIRLTKTVADAIEARINNGDTLPLAEVTVLHNLTTDQIKYLILLQNDTHRAGFIRSLFRAGVLRSETGWGKIGQHLLPDAVPCCVLSNGLNGRKLKYKVYAVDQTEHSGK